VIVAAELKKIYFLGIGGVAMGNAAILTKSTGCHIGGSDRVLYAPMDRLLQAHGISYAEGFSERNLSAFQPDLVVVGNAVSRGNEEVEWLLDSRKFPFTSLPQFLADHFLRGRHRIVFSGTHGKTTSAAICAYYLRQIGVGAGYFIGGAPINFPSGADLGDGLSPFAIEGDEYDSAFFDKRSKFIHYAPDTLAISCIDFDHADIFRDRSDVQRSFSHLLRTVPRRGMVYYNGDDCRCAAVARVPWVPSASVGLDEANDFRLANLQVGEEETSWEIVHGADSVYARSALMGEFNARNASMAILAAHHSLETALPAAVDLRSFSGVRRRQQLLHRDGRCAVYEDFGHHPGAVREVLRSLRLRHGGCELIACFEPASQTSMRKVLAEEFAAAFSLADRCYWARPRRPEAVPEEERLRPEELVAALRGRIGEAEAFGENRLLLERLRAVLGEESPRLRVAVLFSNGAFSDVLPYWKEQGNVRN
jgi:UDP-N-acetylmuramate: L-alanyl-gamma-D-glutamyl-meso-diaminopimelate ligase